MRKGMAKPNASLSPSPFDSPGKVRERKKKKDEKERKKKDGGKVLKTLHICVRERRSPTHLSLSLSLSLTVSGKVRERKKKR